MESERISFDRKPFGNLRGCKSQAKFLSICDAYAEVFGVFDNNVRMVQCIEEAF